MDRRLLLLLLCFFGSGFAALLYETAWTRELSFVFGTSELAVVSVLASYMGGLALGASIAARLVSRVRRPVLVYGLLELAIALCALLVPWAMRGVTAVYAGIFGGLAALPAEGHAVRTLFQLAGSTAVLLAPTALMGATLPLLARHAVRRDEQVGLRIGILYATNTAGALAGTLAAAVWLLPALGLRETVYAGAATNAAVFAAAALLARGSPALAPSAPRARTGGPRWILPCLALSGAASFTYEVLWTRLLAHLLGGSVAAFATMLASFLFGIAAGSALAAPFARDRERSTARFAGLQIAIAALSLGAFAALDGLPALAAILGAGGLGGLGPNALLAGALLTPPALCIGATFPLAVRVLARDESDAPVVSARAYAWNTCGAIAGAVTAGFVLLPETGYAGTVALAVAVNLLVAAAAALFARPSRRAVAALAAAAALAMVFARPPTPWTLLRTTPLTRALVAGEVTHYGVGRAATVLAVDVGNGWRLSSNGLPEAMVLRAGEAPNQFPEAHWLTLLPVLARPEAKSLLVIGLGGGIALESVPPSVERIDAVELEEEVLAANRAIAAERRVDPLSDPRLSVHLGDARGALVLTGARWDAIVSQPSHPWTAGSSHLYTREFFSLVSRHLAPGGVFVQWIGVRFVDEPLLKSLVATLSDVFPHVAVFQPVPAALLFLASAEPLSLEESAGRAIAAQPETFARFGIRTPEDAAAALRLDAESARRFADGARPVTDDRNQLAMQSGRLLGRGLEPARAAETLSSLDPLLALAAGGLDPVRIARRLQESAGSETARSFARALPDPAERSTALGWIELDLGRHRTAARHFEDALAAGASPAARFGLVRAERRALLRGDAELEAVAASLSDGGAAVARGWRAAEAGDWDALRALEPGLAAALPADPAFEDAARLRARWRVQSGEPARAREALALLDDLLAAGGSPRPGRESGAGPDDLVLRARAAAIAGRPETAVASLEHAAKVLAAERPRDRRSAYEALEVARALSDGPRVAPLLRRLAALAR